MRTVIATLMPMIFVGGFVVTCFVATPSAEAKRRCGPSFEVSQNARSKAAQNAKKHAIRKAWRTARQRCGVGRVAVRDSQAWNHQCDRSGKLTRCTAITTFRCCQGARLSKRGKVTKRGKVAKRRKATKRGKRVRKSRITRRRRMTRKTRVARRSRRSKKVRRAVVGGMCKGKHKVEGAAQNKRIASAKREARNKVYQHAKSQCKTKFPRYVSSWKYNCQKSSNGYDCTATNIVRCCNSKTRVSQKKRRTKRPKRRKAN